MRLDNERGAALIMALLVMASFSLLAAAIVFTAQTDVQISANYKYGQQAYYVANAGVQKSLSWFNTAYVSHTPASDYDATKAPVQYPNVNGAPVTLSGKSGVTSNYPDSATSTLFYSNLGDQTLQADSNNAGAYQGSATLLRSRTVRLINPDTFALYYGNLERWRLDSIGFWGTSANPIGRSEVSAVIEKQATPFFSKALWVDQTATFTGGSLVDSYDPTLGPYGGSNIGNNGDVGSNANMRLNGTNTTINGDVWYGPSPGTCSNCSPPNIAGQLSQLVEPKVFPPIIWPVPPGTTDVRLNDGASHTLPPGSYGLISLQSATTLTLSSGTYYIDKLKLTAGTALTIAPGANTTLYIQTDMDVQGAIVNSSQDPAALTILYSGIAKSTLNGGTGFYGTVYAPNTAELTLTGNANYYGSFMAKNLKIAGGANLHYDSDLLNQYLIPKPFRIITWTQKNY